MMGNPEMTAKAQSQDFGPTTSRGLLGWIRRAGLASHRAVVAANEATGMSTKTLISRILPLAGLLATELPAADEKITDLLEWYCFDCHDRAAKKGNLNLEELLERDEFDGSRVFENLLTGKMPPPDEEQPNAEEKRLILDWLADEQSTKPPRSFRRISRHEFVHSLNDLLGTNLDLTDEIPEDRGTHDFDSNRKIQLSREMLGAYFAVADQMLDHAFPPEGFPEEMRWVTNKIRGSHETYRIYHRPYRDGTLFSWTRANNGNSYSFFYDNFDPPVAGWYELTFEAAKVADFEEDMSLQVHAGKYYYADDRPQPQRLVEVISLGHRELAARTIRAFLHPGESVSVHCFSPHNFRERSPQRGIYLKQLTARGPLVESWPPPSYPQVFAGLKIEAQPRVVREAAAPFAPSRVTVVADSPEELKQVLRSFAERAFVSKSSDDDLAPYFKVALEGLADHGNFIRAAKVGLKSILCSPRFLMAPGEHAHSSYTRAAELARALWLSVPDRQLLTLAAKDELRGEVLRSQIHRMLDDPRGERMVRSFADQWLNLRSLNKVTPSLKLYPLYDDLLNFYLPRETHAYLRHLIQENLPAGALVDSDFSFLNQRLARHYGIQGVTGQQMRKVILPPGSPRGGLMTMASVLKVTTDGFDTSPILRGAWISKNIVGTPLSPPPENVPALERKHGAGVRSLKQQIEEHKNNKTCFACHKSIDPYGFALESFDATGAWRETYKVRSKHRGTFQYRPEGYHEAGDEVDPSGEIDGHRFSDILGLKADLLRSEERIAYNFAKKFHEFVNGDEPDLKERLALWNLINEDRGNLRLRTLITRVLLESLTYEKK